MALPLDDNTKSRLTVNKKLSTIATSQQQLITSASLEVQSDNSGDIAVGTQSSHSRHMSVRPESKHSKNTGAKSLTAQRRSLHSPERIARQQYRQALDYEHKMLSRVNYLAKEEEKFMKKIEKTRDEATKIQSIKQGKIEAL